MGKKKLLKALNIQITYLESSLLVMLINFFWVLPLRKWINFPTTLCTFQLCDEFWSRVVLCFFSIAFLHFKPDLHLNSSVFFFSCYPALFSFLLHDFRFLRIGLFLRIFSHNINIFWKWNLHIYATAKQILSGCIVNFKLQCNQCIYSPLSETSCILTSPFHYSTHVYFLHQVGELGKDKCNYIPFC